MSDSANNETVRLEASYEHLRATYGSPKTLLVTSDCSLIEFAFRDITITLALAGEHFSPNKTYEWTTTTLA